MIFIEASLLIIFFLIFPFAIGRNFRQENEIAIENIFEEYVWGISCMFALFEIIAVPMTFMHNKLSAVTQLWMLVCISLALIGFSRRKITKIKLSIASFYKVISLIAVGLILFQILFVVFHMHIDNDDAWYVGTAVASWTTDTMNIIDPNTGEIMAVFPSDYTLSPYPVFFAMLARLVGIHPTILMHTLIPIIMIPLSYMIYFLVANKLFKQKKESVIYFMIFLAIFNLFGFFSDRSTSTFLLLRIWQGKAVLCNIFLPLLIYVFILYMEKGAVKYWFLQMIIIIASTMVSSMGVILCPILLFALAIITFLFQKKIKLGLMSLLCILPCMIELTVYFRVLR